MTGKRTNLMIERKTNLMREARENMMKKVDRRWKIINFLNLWRMQKNLPKMHRKNSKNAKVLFK